MATRNGKQLKTLEQGNRRRMSDGKNAWRKMTPVQRRAFLDWIADENLDVDPPTGHIVAEHAARALVRSINTFEAECQRDGYTCTDVAWELLGEARGVAKLYMAVQS